MGVHLSSFFMKTDEIPLCHILCCHVGIIYIISAHSFGILTGCLIITVHRRQDNLFGPVNLIVTVGKIPKFCILRLLLCYQIGSIGKIGGNLVILFPILLICTQSRLVLISSTSGFAVPQDGIEFI